MEKMSKILLIVLGGILVIMIVFSLQTFSQKQQLEQSVGIMQQEAQQQKQDLQSKLNAIANERSQIKESLGTLKRDMDRITSERDDWKKKYDVALQDKEKLIEELKNLSRQPVVTQPAETVTTPATAASGQPARTNAYWAEVVKEKEALAIKLNNLKGELNQQVIKFNTIKQAQNNASLDLSKLVQDKNEFERKLKFSEELVSNISLELVQERNDKFLVMEEFNRIKSDNSKLRRQVKELAAAKISLQKGLKQLSSEKDQLQRKIIETEGLVRSRLNDLLQLQDEIETAYRGGGGVGSAGSIELPPIVVRASGVADDEISNALMPPLTQEGVAGNVISVNQESNFAIIDIGSDAGVGVGNVFKAYRNGEQIAILEVIETRGDISAVDVKDEQEKLAVGDVVQ
ncbi:hypothetical protein ACFL38_04315 [Candidatus Omnitrophota bacterium]